MKLSGEERIGASPAAVWAALIDPEVLAPLIPGCESMSGSPAMGYDLAASRSVAGLEVRLTGRVDLTASRPGEGCDLVASGSGGKAGGARGTARIRLQPDGEGTRLRYELDASVEGALSRIPGFVLRIAAGRVAEGFMGRFKAAVEAKGPSRPPGRLR